jgi:hypothetical protein
LGDVRLRIRKKKKRDAPSRTGIERGLKKKLLGLKETLKDGGRHSIVLARSPWGIIFVF